jgi:PIN domain nuclease of toxin-antitoxin system
MAAAKYLLDTHCLIWFQENNLQIPERVMQTIQDTNNEFYLARLVCLK